MRPNPLKCHILQKSRKINNFNNKISNSLELRLDNPGLYCQGLGVDNGFGLQQSSSQQLPKCETGETLSQAVHQQFAPTWCGPQLGIITLTINTQHTVFQYPTPAPIGILERLGDPYS